MNTPHATGAKPNVVSAEEWAQARAELLAAEKEVTHAEDAVAAQRRRLPMVRFRSDYAFAAPSGPVSLRDLFAGHDQLLLYQFMDLGPDRLVSGLHVGHRRHPGEWPHTARPSWRELGHSVRHAAGAVAEGVGATGLDARAVRVLARHDVLR